MHARSGVSAIPLSGPNLLVDVTKVSQRFQLSASLYVTHRATPQRPQTARSDGVPVSTFSIASPVQIQTFPCRDDSASGICEGEFRSQPDVQVPIQPYSDTESCVPIIQYPASLTYLPSRYSFPCRFIYSVALPHAYRGLCTHPRPFAQTWIHSEPRTTTIIRSSSTALKKKRSC
jgi:hypothetical protein